MEKAKRVEKDNYLKALAIQAQQGDELSYRELLLAVANLLRPFIIKHTFNKDNTEDILQESLLGIHKALHTYDKSNSFLTWMFAICRYKIIDYIRKYQRISENEINNDEFIATFCAQETNNIDEGFEEELQDALDALPEKQRQVVLMLKVNEYSVKEVSKELKMSISNVKTTAHRAYKALRKSILEKRSSL